MGDRERAIMNRITNPGDMDPDHPGSRGPRVAITQGIPPPNEGYRMGVCGISESNVGVWGETTTGPSAVHGEHVGNGIGVDGESRHGIGVHGKGEVLAGLFEGDVEVTKTLTVKKVNLLDLVQQLQQSIADREAQESGGEQRLNAIEQRLNVIDQTLSKLSEIVAGLANVAHLPGQ